MLCCAVWRQGWRAVLQNVSPPRACGCPGHAGLRRGPLAGGALEPRRAWFAQAINTLPRTALTDAAAGSCVIEDRLSAQVRLSADLLGSGANRSLAAHLGPNGLSPPSSAARVLLLNNTQPLLRSGQLRWALNNVATYKTPSCLPTLAQVRGPVSMLAPSVCAVAELASSCTP